MESLHELIVLYLKLPDSLAKDELRKTIDNLLFTRTNTAEDAETFTKEMCDNE